MFLPIRHKHMYHTTPQEKCKLKLEQIDKIETALTTSSAGGNGVISALWKSQVLIMTVTCSILDPKTINIYTHSLRSVWEIIMFDPGIWPCQQVSQFRFYFSLFLIFKLFVATELFWACSPPRTLPTTGLDQGIANIQISMPFRAENFL